MASDVLLTSQGHTVAKSMKIGDLGIVVSSWVRPDDHLSGEYSSVASSVVFSGSEGHNDSL